MQKLTMPSMMQKVAFRIEPSAGSCAFLQRNLGRLRIRTEAINKALSSFEGRGELERPEYDTSDCGRYLAMSPDGSIEVTTLDSMLRDSAPALVVKLDIEGGELAALKGARHTLRSAENVIVVMEAHPKVTQRTGIDPIECLRLPNSWRPFQFVVDQKPAAIAESRHSTARPHSRTARNPARRAVPICEYSPFVGSPNRIRSSR
jgi:FkbM family methyltransferase